MFVSLLSNKFAQIMPLGPKVAPAWASNFYIGLYKENLSETTRPRALILCM